MITMIDQLNRLFVYLFCILSHGKVQFFNYTSFFEKSFTCYFIAKENHYLNNHKIVVTSQNRVFSIKPYNKQRENTDVQLPQLSAKDIDNFPQKLSDIYYQNGTLDNRTIAGSKYNFVHFFKNLAHKYISEEIIFYKSSSKILADSLKKEQLLSPKEKLKRKEFQKNLKRALQVEQIHFSAPIRANKQQTREIKIPWNKNLLLSNPKKSIKKITFFKSRRSPEFPTSREKDLLKSLQNFPVFSVENNLRQIILSYPQEAFIKNFQDRLYDFYYRLFLWEHDTRATNLGFFFFNPNDAQLYLSNINRFGALSASDLGTRIIPIRFSTAYKLHQTSSPETRFIFVPDIKEIGDLVSVHQAKEKRRIRFHSNQQITRDSFANQPIYIIQDIFIKRRLFSKESIQYKFNDDNDSRIHLFLSLEGADAAWSSYKRKNKSLKLPDKPTLLVYNVHDFLKEYKHNASITEFTLVPNRQTVEFINSLRTKELVQSSLSRYYDRVVAPKTFFIYLWLKRIKLVLLHAPRINEFPRRELLLSEKDRKTI